MEEAIEKVKRLADGTDPTPFSSEEYMMYFSYPKGKCKYISFSFVISNLIAY